MDFTRRDVLRWTGVGGASLVGSTTDGAGERLDSTRPDSTFDATGWRTNTVQEEDGLIAAFNALSEDVEFFLDGERISDPVPPGDKLRHGPAAPGTYTLTVSVDGGTPTGGLTFDIAPDDLKTAAAVGSPGDPMIEVFDDRRIDLTKPFAWVQWYNGFFEGMDVVTCPLGSTTAGKQPFRDIGEGETSPPLSVFDDPDANVGMAAFEIYEDGRFVSETGGATDPQLIQDGILYRGYATDAGDGSPFVTVQGVTDLRSTTYFWNLSDEPVSVWVSDLTDTLQRLGTLGPGEESQVFAGKPNPAAVVGFGPVDADGPTAIRVSAFASQDYCVFLDDFGEEVGILDVTTPAPEPEAATLRVTNRGSRYLTVLFNGQEVVSLTRNLEIDRETVLGAGDAEQIIRTLDASLLANLPPADAITLPESCGSVPLPTGEGTLEIVDGVFGTPVFSEEVTIEPGTSYDLLIPRRGDPGFIESPIDRSTSVMTEMEQLLVPGI